MNAKQIIIKLESMGFTRYRIAKETGLSQSVLSRLVNGDRAIGSHPTNLTLQSFLALQEARKLGGLNR